jgi:HlyD family secretion protein
MGIKMIKKSHLALLLTAAFCVVFISVLSVKWKDNAGAERKTDFQAPGQVSCLGRIVPGERVIRVTVASPSVVKELKVKRWDQVEKGQILAVLLDYNASLASLREAEARVAVAESQLARVKAGEKTGTIAAQEAVVARQEFGLKTSRSNYERYKVLFDNGAVSRSQYEDAELALEKALRGFEEAKQTLASLKDVRPVDVTLKEKELNEARTGRDLAKAKLELCAVRSPLDGRVIEINTYPGESIGQAGILNLADLVLMVDAEVYVTDISKVRIGSKAVITGDGIEGEVKGTVTEVLKSVMDNGLVSPNPLAFSDRRVIRARIRVEEPAKIASLINSQVFVKILP